MSELSAHGLTSVTTAKMGEAQGRPQSLMGLTLTVSLIVGVFLCTAVASIIVLNARQAIYEETRSAFASAQANIALRMPRQFAGNDTMGKAMELADEIDALRHVAAAVVDSNGAPLPQRAHNAVQAESAGAPEWFVRLMSPEPFSENLVISHYPNILGHLVVSTDPSDEIAEVWDDFRTILPLLALTGLVMLGLTLFVCRLFIRRLDALQDAVTAIRMGDTSRRTPNTRLREFAALGRGIDDLAIFLRQERHANRKLQKRILTLSEAERAKIAFDLHDEMGPLLFALNVALSQAQREAANLGAERSEQLSEALEASIEHARSVQDRARAAINDLRPMLVGHASLYEVLSELISEFSSIAPGVSIQLDAEPHLDTRTNELADISIYRFIRESMLNAIRHGHANQIKVTLRSFNRPDCHLIAQVTDNGRGPPEKPVSRGYGLAGIHDRALALGAEFTPPQHQAGRTITKLRMPCQ